MLGASSGLAPEARAAQAYWPPCHLLPPGAKTWNQYFGAQLPGAVAVIEQGDVVYLTASPVELSFLEIKGTLVWDHCWNQLELRAAAILVRDQGEFQIGSAALPFPREATVTLIDWPLGAAPNEVNNPLYTDEVRDALNDRGLVVCNGGTLRVHGKEQDRSWTRLNASAPAMAGQITVADSGLPWSLDQEIVLASTDFDQDQAEVHSILQVNGAVIDLNGSLLGHMHYGEVQNFAPIGAVVSEWDVDQRGEVGLLSRNVVIQGEKDAGALNSPEHYGHVFFCKEGTNPPRIELEWMSFRNLGVGGVAGRYPVHFHQIGDPGPTTPLFIRDCSVRNTRNRGIVLHDTQKVTVENNVVYDTMGYGIYVETPATINNELIDNLVLVNRIYENPQSGAVFDADPGNLVLKSLQNIVRGNVAAGSVQFGIYYPLATTEVHPTAGFEFANNVAHSAGKIGIFQDSSILTSAPLVFTDSRVWKCREHGMWIRSLDSFQVNGLIAADCRSGFYPASKGIRAAGEGYQLLTNGLFVGETANLGEFDANKPWESNAQRSLPQDQPDFPNHELTWDPLNAIEVYDGFLEVEGCRFAKFQDRLLPERRPAAALTQVAKYTTWINDPRNRVNTLSFGNNVDRKIWFRNPLAGQNQIAFTLVVDEDNSFGYGASGQSMLFYPNTPFLGFDYPGNYYADSPTSPGLNGYALPSTAVQHGQLVVELNQAASPNQDAWTTWRQVIDPLVTPVLGDPWQCETVPTGSPLGGNGHYRFPVVLEVGALNLTADLVRYYRMEYQQVPPNLPNDLDVTLRFTPGTAQTVFVEIPYNGGLGPNGEPRFVQYINELGATKDAHQYQSLGALLGSGVAKSQAWYYSAVDQRVHLKLTSLLQDGKSLDPFGTQTEFHILE